MQKQKMIVFDLDGTLLHDDKTLSDHTLASVEKCWRFPVKIAVATARPLRTTIDYARKLKADYMICHNGAVTAGTNYLEKISIDKEDIGMIIKLINNFTIKKMIAIEANDRMTANFPAEDVWGGHDYDKSAFEEIEMDHADKILFFLDKDDPVEEMQKRLPDPYYLVVIEEDLGMIMNKNATKYQAVCSVLEKEGISIRDTYFFGNDYNDIELLEKAGVGVAVSNACMEAKAAANYICESNNDDGAALWLDGEFV